MQWEELAPGHPYFDDNCLTYEMRNGESRAVLTTSLEWESGWYLAALFIGIDEEKLDAPDAAAAKLEAVERIKNCVAAGTNFLGQLPDGD